MKHLWVRAEQRPFEERVGITPDGVAALIGAGIRVSVEASSVRAIPIDGYRAAGATIVPENSWPTAPQDAIIFGLKELPEDGTPLPHRHIMFGHAFKGQPAGQVLLGRFKTGDRLHPRQEQPPILRAKKRLFQRPLGLRLATIRIQ